MKAILTFYLIMFLLFPLASFAQEPYGQEMPLLPQKPQDIPTTEKPVEIWTFPATHRLVTGKTLLLTVQVIWRLGINVELEGLSQVDLSPFKVEKVTIGERQIFENERDYRVVQYLLSLPDEAREGEYLVPSFSVSYMDEVEKRRGKASSSTVSIRKVPIVAQVEVDKDVVETGDIIHYSLTIFHEKDVKVLLKNLERPNFEPFTLLRRGLREEDSPRLKKTRVDYYLSIYEPGSDKKKYEIPALSIFYYRGTERAKGEGKLIETQEIRTRPIPVIINRLLKTVDVPLEGLKGPLCYREIDLYLQGYLAIALGATMLLLLFGASGLQKVKENFFYPREKPVEAPKLAAQELEFLLSAFHLSGEEYQDRRHLEGLDRALRVLLGSLSGLPRQKALCLTTTDLISSLNSDSAFLADKVLRRLDGIIFGEGLERTEVEEALKGMEEIIRLVVSPPKADESNGR